MARVPSVLSPRKLDTPLLGNLRSASSSKLGLAIGRYRLVSEGLASPILTGVALSAAGSVGDAVGRIADGIRCVGRGVGDSSEEEGRERQFARAADLIAF